MLITVYKWINKWTINQWSRNNYIKLMYVILFVFLFIECQIDVKNYVNQFFNAHNKDEDIAYKK